MPPWPSCSMTRYGPTVSPAAKGMHPPVGYKRGRPLTGALWTSANLTVLQDNHAGKFLPFEELERGSAAGGDVCDLVRQAGAVDRRDRVASADDGGGARGGHRLRQQSGPLIERRHFEHAHRAVPHDELGAAQRVGVTLGCL